MNQIRPFLAMLTLVGLAACGPASEGPGAKPAPTAETKQSACQPSKIQPTASGFSEVRATMNSSGEIWALLFFDTARTLTDEKIVWRISGSGQLDFRAENGNGIVIHPVWGPDFHESSNWNRPGEEWGTGFNFPERGCWTITVTHGATVGEIRLSVLAP